MKTCYTCKANKVCDHDKYGFENCGNYIPEDAVEVVRCGKCIHAVELDKHCKINRKAYRHCTLCRGEETINVWHKYKKYYKDYSIVELNGYCDEGERRDA